MARGEGEREVAEARFASRQAALGKTEGHGDHPFVCLLPAQGKGEGRGGRESCKLLMAWRMRDSRSGHGS